jgi:PPM family protein phosphatase
MLRVVEKAERTDPGRLRRNNEDSSLARSPLFVVADGMGGAQAGEVASAKAIEVFQDGLPDEGGSAEERLAALVVEANARVHELSVSDRDLHGMGTTTTAVYVGEEEVALAHVGDSRAYLLRDDGFERLTSDHTLVEELVRQGRITPEEADEHPQRSIVTRSVGPEAEVEVDRLTLRGRNGDLFLVCSDGLTSMVPEPQVGEIARRAAPLDDIARALVQAANDAGGRDNITVVLFRLEEVGAGSTADDRTMVGEASPTAAEIRAAVQAAGPAEPASRADRAREVVARAPRPPRPPRSERRRRRGWGALIVTLLLLLPVIGGGYIASQAVYFLGVASNGSVTVFQGLPYDLPFGLHLYSRYGSPSGVTFDQIPAARRETFTDHKLRSLDDSENLLNALEEGKLEP